MTLKELNEKAKELGLDKNVELALFDYDRGWVMLSHISNKYEVKDRKGKKLKCFTLS